MENNNGRGIFYGVIGVATLVVAIIGATFAYFSVTATGGAGKANASSVSLSGTLVWTDTDQQIGSKLIPATKPIMLQSYGFSGANHCKGKSAAGGDVLYDLCSTYDFSIQNTAEVNQTIYFTLTSVTNTFGHESTEGNLTFCLYKKNAVTEGSELGGCKKVAAQGGSVSNFFSENITAGATNEYVLVLYINELGDQDQTPQDSGKTFTGTMSVSTASGDAKVTGSVVGLS